MHYSRTVPSNMLEPLTTLAARVKRVCDLSEPDYICEAPRLHEDLRFIVLDLDEHPGGLTGEDISLQIQGIDHLFSEWSRHQLLQHLGTKEKWFRRVTLHDQAKELTRRVHTFDRQVFRRMRTYDDINFVRGLVSAGFVDIPDLSVMTSLCQIVPDGESISTYSGKTDKAFYVYAMSRAKPIGFGKEATGLPGVIVKNSEVGATALTVVPFFLLINSKGLTAPVALRRHAMLRKIHRGQLADLKQSLDQALIELQALWGTMQDKADVLLSRRFPSAQEALKKLEDVLTALHVPKYFIQRVTTTYGAAQNTAHNGLTLLTAVLAASATKQLDCRYDDAEVAGYLLLHLL